MSRLTDRLAFGTRHVGRAVLVFDELPSTNDRAFEADPGTVIVADHQTAGRGQYGRVWSEPAGTSLLVSVVVDPPVELRRPVLLTAWVAVTVASVVDQLTGQRASIKWPNDVLVGGKKVCGILIEQRAVTVAGLGLNLNQSSADFSALGLPHATSLAELAGGPVDPRTALAMLVRQLDDGYDRLTEGERCHLEHEWRTRLGLLGRQVAVEQHSGTRSIGRLMNVEFEGIELAHGGPGAVSVLKPENIRHLSAV